MGIFFKFIQFWKPLKALRWIASRGKILETEWFLDQLQTMNLDRIRIAFALKLNTFISSPRCRTFQPPWNYKSLNVEVSFATHRKMESFALGTSIYFGENRQISKKSIKPTPTCLSKATLVVMFTAMAKCYPDLLFL